VITCWNWRIGRVTFVVDPESHVGRFAVAAGYVGALRDRPAKNWWSDLMMKHAAKIGQDHCAIMLAGVLALSVALGTPLEARADDAAAKALVKAMSDYMAAQRAISFSFDSDLEIVTKDKQKLALASSGTVTLSRPDKIHVTRRGGFADVEAIFDGKRPSLIRRNANVYGQVDVPGSIGHQGV